MGIAYVYMPRRQKKMKFIYYPKKGFKCSSFENTRSFYYQKNKGGKIVPFPFFFFVLVYLVLNVWQHEYLYFRSELGFY